MTKRGAYVTIDGPDGVGKTYQAQILASRTGSLFTREPGGYVTEIREVILNPHIDLTPEAEVLLFSADRNVILRRFTEPNLAQGRSVVSDRSFLSTIAYQGYGRGLNIDYIKAATKLALGDTRADKIVILDAPLDVTLDRLEGTGKKATDDRFEQEGREFHTKVRNGFLELVTEIGSRAIVLDASGTKEEVAQVVFEACGQLLLDGVAIET